MPVAASYNTTTNQTTFENCLAQCNNDTCQFVNYNYDTMECMAVIDPGQATNGVGDVAT